ncbi:notch-regulated ankyrin repeat-containing protein A isoform X1 [Larimichthys crocea]|uniref:notch-regulated ankyrin repeat-containing protein A isoform X1 n=1 Tax=Larimichthys crocea TaxID=215358 RepID=UPI000F5E7F00|nr:notch-regulated ankyrin repeat-containing protein isoform X1 [Larimichthys crocea]
MFTEVIAAGVKLDHSSRHNHNPREPARRESKTHREDAKSVMHIYQKGDITDIKGTGTIQKGMLPWQHMLCRTCLKCCPTFCHHHHHHHCYQQTGQSAAQGRDSHGPRGGHRPGHTVDLYRFRRYGPVHLSQTPWPHEQRHIARTCSQETGRTVQGKPAEAALWRYTSSFPK